jgi:PEP-CTERM motif
MRVNLLKVAIAGAFALNCHSASAETIGAPLVQRSILDLAQGSIFALNDGFSSGGVLSSWSFYDLNGGAVGRYITPLLFSKSASGYIIQAVGESRMNDGSGIQTFTFSSVSGAPLVQAGMLFGWKQGQDADPYTQGVVEFDVVPQVSAGTQQYFGEHHAGDLVLNNNLGLGIELNASAGSFRDYSIQATISAVPEPGAIALSLAGLGIAGLVNRRKA